MNILKAVQRSAKVRAVKKKMREADMKRKKISAAYKKAVKEEARKLARSNKKTARKTTKRKKRR